jgi:hypothetical protein
MTFSILSISVNDVFKFFNTLLVKKFKYWNYFDFMFLVCVIL